MAERLNALVLKTSEGNTSVGLNPTFSTVAIVQWLEHWIVVPVIWVRVPIVTQF